MKVKGQITVFLSLALLCMLGLICGLLESARMAGARCYLQMAACSALDSVMSEYHRSLWEEYRVLGLEYTDDQAVEQEFQRFLEEYGEAANWYPMEPELVEVQEIVHLTDGNGRFLEQEILDYMKYGIWTQDWDVDLAQELTKAIKEAQSVNQVARQLEDQTREAWKLEKALEELAGCLEKQKEYYGEAARALERGSGSEFQRKANKLKTELNRVPRLVEAYGKKADELNGELEKVKLDYEEKKLDISADVQQAMADELARYETYTAKDGERRLEVERLTEQAGLQRMLVEQVMEEAEEVERDIDSWEPADEDDTLDEDALWAPVRQHFAEYDALTLSCQAGGEDTESEGLLNRIREIADQGILELVLPDGTVVSQAEWLDTGLPSQGGPGKPVSGELMPDGAANLADRVMIGEYCGAFFANFCSGERKEIQYEMEYLLFGNREEKTNLSDAVYRLLAVREGLNLVTIFMDPEKRSQAETLAAAIVGAAGFPPLVGITSFFIMGVWALGESLVDIKLLLGGGKVPVIKDAGSWNLELEDLLELGRTGQVVQKNGGNGANYTAYLKLFFLLADREELVFRMLDVMQVNLEREEVGFRMDRCACLVDIRTEVCGKHVFFSLGLLKGLTGKVPSQYRYGAEARRGY